MMGGPARMRDASSPSLRPLDGVLCVVEVTSVPEGLFGFVLRRPHPPNTILVAPDEGARDEESMALPQRVAISDALLKRKPGEIGDHVLRGRIGSEVDPHVAKLLGQRTTCPLHPAPSPRSRANLGALEMARRPHRVRSFLHTVPQLEPPGRSGGSLGTPRSSRARDTSAFGLAVREWIGQWGLSSIDELCSTRVGSTPRSAITTPREPSSTWRPARARASARRASRSSRLTSSLPNTVKGRARVEILFVRHGEPAWMPDGFARNDPGLTELGRRQAELLADHFRLKRSTTSGSSR